MVWVNGVRWQCQELSGPASLFAYSFNLPLWERELFLLGSFPSSGCHTWACVCEAEGGETSGVQTVVPRPVASASGACQEGKFLGFPPDRLKQQLWAWNPRIWVLSSPMPAEVWEPLVRTLIFQGLLRGRMQSGGHDGRNFMRTLGPATEVEGWRGFLWMNQGLQIKCITIYGEDFNIYPVSPAWLQLAGENKMPFVPSKRSDAKLIWKISVFAYDRGLFNTLPRFNCNIPIFNSWLCLTRENKGDKFNSKKIINVLSAGRIYSQLIPRQWQEHLLPNQPHPVSRSFLAQGPSQHLPHSCWYEECAKMMEELGHSR